jgi:hypothetical protein
VQAAGRSPTVREWLGQWPDQFAARKSSPGTLASYRRIVRLHVRPNIGHQRLDSPQPEHLEQLYPELAGKGLRPASILRAHRVLSPGS